MCDMLENEKELGACYWTIIVRARDVFTTKQEFDNFCKRIAPQWRKWCADAEAQVSS